MYTWISGMEICYRAQNVERCASEQVLRKRRECGGMGM
jgi:hypothetical protein